VVFLDSEGGVNQDYFKNFGIDPGRVIHMPVTNIEEAKFQIVNILEEVKRGERLVFMFDSIGNAASVKELEDAKDNKSKADMSRAKALKSFFRIVTPYLVMNNIPFIGINHTYSTQDFFPTEVMSGGQGPLLSANTVFFMGKAKDKDGTELAGFNFRVKVHKSRTVREGSVFTINIDFENGIDRHSDLFEAAVEHGDIEKSGNSYVLAGKFNDGAKYKRQDFRFLELGQGPWKPILMDEDFKEWYEGRHRLAWRRQDVGEETPAKSGKRARAKKIKPEGESSDGE
jgi:hypothetical protein